MNINRIDDVRPHSPDTGVTVKMCGNVVEIRYSVQGPPEIVIEKLSSALYVDKRTGEVKEFQHTTSRAEDNPGGFMRTSAASGNDSNTISKSMTTRPPST